MVKKQIRKKSIRLNKNLKSETFVRTLARFEFTKLLGQAYNLAHWQTTINDTVDVISTQLLMVHIAVQDCK